MATAYIAIGLPGKRLTDALKEQNPAAHHINFYEVRDQVHKLREQRGVKTDTWTEIYRQIRQILIWDQDVIVDAICFGIYFRKQLVDHCRRHNATVVGVWVKSSLEDCDEQFRQDKPAHKINALLRDLEQKPPTHQEGFSKIIVID